MSTSQTALIHVLKDHDIRKTGSRLDILRLFTDRGHALSQPDLEKALEEQCDRVTIYRTLTLFLEKGLIHNVLDDSGAMKYALCRGTCDHSEHQHDHVHFKCVQCGRTTCIEDARIPNIKLPNGFKIQEQNILMTGVCSGCSQSQTN